MFESMKFGGNNVDKKEEKIPTGEATELDVHDVEPAPAPIPVPDEVAELDVEVVEPAPERRI